MGRLPFNARAARREPAASGSLGQRPVSVAALATMIDQAIRGGLPGTVVVRGEVSGFRDRTHWYFDLKDGDAVVSCVVFASSARRLQRVSDGQAVVVTGRVEFYAKAGKVSLIATGVRQEGVGAIDEAFRRLLEELRGLGWLDPERKRRLPVFPRRIAVVTSRSSAALQDVLDTLRRRCPTITVVLADARMQGDAAPAEIAARVRELSDRCEELALDAIIVTRGGGSAEDLSAFNDRGVAQAIHDARVPVVAAIGHETDTTIAELVADVRAATPTQAAVMVSPDRDAVLEQIDSRASRLEHGLGRVLAESRRRLAGVVTRSPMTRPGSALAVRHEQLVRMTRDMGRGTSRLLERREARLAGLRLRLMRLRPDRVASHEMVQQNARLVEARTRLRMAIRARLIGHTGRAGAAARELQAVGPLEVLARGYSVTLDAKGRVIRGVAGAAPGSTIETRLSDGSVRSVVGGVPDSTRAPRRRTKNPDQMDLFDRRG